MRRVAAWLFARGRVAIYTAPGMRRAGATVFKKSDVDEERKKPFHPGKKPFLLGLPLPGKSRGTAGFG